MRALYAVFVIAELLNINSDELRKNSIDYIKRCQTYEGGIAPEPFIEAHGGYTFCGIAALSILKGIKNIDIENLKYWLVNKQ